MDKNFRSNFIKGSAATSVGTMFSIVFHFLSIMIMTRYISKDDFGIYTIIIAIAYLFNLLGGLGLDITIVKFISSENADDRKKYFFPIIVMRFIQLLLMFIIFYSIGHVIGKLFNVQIDQFIFVIPILFFLTSFRELFNRLLQGLKLFKKYAIVQIVSAIFRISILLLFLKINKLNLVNLINIEIIVTVFALIIQLIAAPLKSLICFHQNSATYKHIIKFSFPLYLNHLLGFVRERVNIFLIGAFVNPASVALYDIAQKIPMGLDKIFQSFIIVYFPNLSNLFSQGKKDDAQKVMNKSMILLSIGITFTVFVSFLFRNEIIVIIFSNSYAQSSMAFALLMLNFYLKSISNLMGYSLVSAGYSSIPVKVNSISSVVNLICGLVMIPIIGFIGAVYSLLFMNIVSQILFYLYLLKLKIAPNVNVYLKIVVLLLITSGIYLIFNSETLSLKLIFIVLFLLSNWLLVKEFRYYSNIGLKYISHFSLKKWIIVNRKI